VILFVRFFSASRTFLSDFFPASRTGTVPVFLFVRFFSVILQRISKDILIYANFYVFTSFRKSIIENKHFAHYLHSIFIIVSGSWIRITLHTNPVYLFLLKEKSKQIK